MTNKTPFLDGFPTTLFGRAKASGQAILRKTRQAIAERCPGSISSLFSEVIAPALVASLAANQRVRHFPHEVTFWAFLSQTLSEDRSCARAVAEVQNWRSQQGQDLPSADTSSYCKARQRLPIEMLDAIHDKLRVSLDRQTPSELLWHGHLAKAIDASSAQMPDTPENQAAFPQPSNQQPGCGFPVLQFAGLINLCNGAWEQFVVSEMTVHDHKLLDSMMPFIEPNEVLVADRAFCSYEMLARVSARQSWMVARLHQMRKMDWRKGKKAGPNQRIVIWHKSQQPKGSCLSREEWAQLPEEMQVRVIRIRGVGRDGKPKTMFLATTLLDTVAYPEEDIAALYFQRWEIELRFRDLKTTMGMELLRTKTPEMARKELAMFIIAYNALRLLMLQASVRNNAPLWRISFKGTIQVISTWHARFEELKHKPRLKGALMQDLLEQIARRKVPERPGRHEPRVVKRRPKPFPNMTQPRSEYHESWQQNAAC